MNQPLKITILGATGSIGVSTLKVIQAYPEQYQVYALTGHKNVSLILQQASLVKPQIIVMADEASANEVRAAVLKMQLAIQVESGLDALIAVSQQAEVDLVMAAIVGAAGLLPTYAAIQAGKKVLLANKEALVMSGRLFMDAVQINGAELLPVDSEHNAIFQSLPEQVQKQLGQVNLADYGVEKLLLTGSGGPFLNLPLNALPTQTVEAACAHPNWSMGKKISVDSATMLNKGLEYIEARWLFNAKPDEIEVLIHPQSVIHSMVQYSDGSVLAQLGLPDMKTPIAHALSYPKRIQSGVPNLDFTQLNQLTFMAPDFKRYPCLALAIQACWDGQVATTALNAANEVAVSHFLQGNISFGAISAVCQSTLAHPSLSQFNINNIEDAIACDEAARCYTQELIAQGAYLV